MDYDNLFIFKVSKIKDLTELTPRTSINSAVKNRLNPFTEPESDLRKANLG